MAPPCRSTYPAPLNHTRSRLLQSAWPAFRAPAALETRGTHTSYFTLQAIHFETIMKISKYRKVKRNSNKARASSRCLTQLPHSHLEVHFHRALWEPVPMSCHHPSCPVALAQSQLSLSSPYLYFGVCGFYLFPASLKNGFCGFEWFPREKGENADLCRHVHAGSPNEILYKLPTGWTFCLNLLIPQFIVL